MLFRSNEKTSYQNLWDTFNAVSRAKYIAISALMRSKKRSKTDTLSSKLKKLEEQDQKNSKPSRTQEITKIRAKLKEIETQKNPSKNQQIQELVFRKDEQNRPLARLIKKKRENKQIDAIKTIKGISPQNPRKFKPSSEIITNNSMHINY